MCMHRTMDILKKAEILKYYTEGIPYDRSKELYQDKVKMKNFESILGVMNSLGMALYFDQSHFLVLNQ